MDLDQKKKKGRKKRMRPVAIAWLGLHAAVVGNVGRGVVLQLHGYTRPRVKAVCLLSPITPI